MSQAKNISRLYRRQAKRFESWTNDWLTCGYLLWKVQSEIGDANLNAWLKKNCRAVDPELAREMIRQLQETETGRQLLADLHHTTL